MTAREESISERDYARLCKLIYSERHSFRRGKEDHARVRIKRRLKALDVESYGQYCENLFAHNGLKHEITHLIDVVTTNKTDFFREPAHFNFLAGRALPELTGRNPGRRFQIWSAGCSSGEEPYTMAIVLSEYALAHASFRFRILASDISTTVLKKAEQGVYTDEIVAPVQPLLRRKYFMRSRDPGSDRFGWCRNCDRASSFAA